jgi:hypothetical protein
MEKRNLKRQLETGNIIEGNFESIVLAGSTNIRPWRGRFVLLCSRAQQYLAFWTISLANDVWSDRLRTGTPAKSATLPRAATAVLHFCDNTSRYLLEASAIKASDGRL